MEFWQTQPPPKIIPHETPGKQWKTEGTDISTINNRHFLHIVDCNSEFPIIKGPDGQQNNLRDVAKYYMLNMAYHVK